MTFLHPEFLYILIPLTLFLFSFWITKKPFEHLWLSDKVLNQLRVTTTTMGITTRNILFLCVAILFIIALAQPVAFNDSLGHRNKQINFEIIIDLDSTREQFSKNLDLAHYIIEYLPNASIELKGWSKKYYQISPLTENHKILAQLIDGLEPLNIIESGKNSEIIDNAILSSYPRIIITQKQLKCNANEIIIDSLQDVKRLDEFIQAEQKKILLIDHTPLFFYPLGLAMILMAIALSSMSKRIPVEVLMVVMMLSELSVASSHASVFDFKLLGDAKKAYESGDFVRSSQLFKRYRQEHPSAQANYNYANSLYQCGRYDEALYWYRKVYTTDILLKKYTLHNINQTLLMIDTPSRKTHKKEVISKELVFKKSENLIIRKDFQKTKLYQINIE